MNATNKRESVSKLVKAWESKNAKRAAQGAGLTTMAVTLAACGGEDDTPFSQVDVDGAVAAANAAAEAAKEAAVAFEVAKTVAAEAAYNAALADAAAANAALEDAEEALLLANAAAEEYRIARDAALTAKAEAEEAQAVAEAAKEQAQLTLFLYQNSVRDAGFDDLDALIDGYSSLVSDLAPLTGGQLTENVDTIVLLRGTDLTGEAANFGAGDTVVGIGGNTLTLTASADISSTGIASGVQNIVINSSKLSGSALSVNLDSIANGTVTINTPAVLDLLLNDTIAHDVAVSNAGDITVVAGELVATLTVAMKEDASTVVNAGDAAAVTINPAGGVDQVATFVANGDVALNIDSAFLGGALTDVNITSTVASTVTLDDDGGWVDTVSGDANTTLSSGMSPNNALTDFNNYTIVGVAALVGGTGGSGDLTGVAAPITINDNSVPVTFLTLADAADVTLEESGVSVFFRADDDGDVAAASSQSLDLTLGGTTTAASIYQITLNTDTVDGDDEINTLNVEVGAALTAAAATGDLTIDTSANALDTTINFSGASAADVTFVTGAGGDLTVNASAMTGALTAAVGAGLVSVTGGSGNDVFELFGGFSADLVVDGGLGFDTFAGLALASSDIRQMSISGIDVLDGFGFQGLASQFHNANYVVDAGTSITIDSAAVGSVDLSTIDLSGLQFVDSTTTVAVDVSSINFAQFLSTQTFNITGSDAEDTITGADNADTINGGAGDDTIYGGAGNDTISGGNGIDLLNGQAGNDTINGGDGDDSMSGGAGADTLTGGAGADTFVFDSLTGADTVVDYSVTDDSISLSVATFTALTTGAGNPLTAGEFLSVADATALTGGSVAAAADAEQFIYLQDTGELYYNSDAATAGGLTLVATFTGAPELLVGEFAVIA